MEKRNLIEEYLIEMDLSYEIIHENMWLIEDLDKNNKLVIYLNDNIVVFRIKVMEILKNCSVNFYKKLLELNAYDLVHGAYALEDDNVVIVDTLRAENLDLNEFRASIESIELSIAHHKEIFKGFM